MRREARSPAAGPANHPQHPKRDQREKRQAQQRACEDKTEHAECSVAPCCGHEQNDWRESQDGGIKDDKIVHEPEMRGVVGEQQRTVRYRRSRGSYSIPQRTRLRGVREYKSCTDYRVQDHPTGCKRQGDSHGPVRASSAGPRRKYNIAEKKPANMKNVGRVNA
jgi:hypothetical protein